MAASASDTFLTIASPTKGLYKDKGSKFLAFAYPITTEEEVKEIVTQLKKEYFDARHHCYAFMIGTNSARYRANDDGEPNHSAGDPILGQIRSMGLTNILVVVVRYFGGIKLGVSGLIQAYRTAAAEALAAAMVIEKIETETLELAFAYENMNEIMSVVKDYKLNITAQDFSLDCRLTLSVRKNLKAEVLAKLNTLATINIL